MIHYFKRPAPLTFVEELEQQLPIVHHLAQIEDQGGAVSSIEQGFMQREIQNLRSLKFEDVAR